MLADLIRESHEFGEARAMYYEGKIADLKAAMAGKFGGGVNEKTGEI